jgi:hypothetical protein
VNDKLEMIWKEAVVANFKVISRYSSGGTEVKPENPQSGYQVFGSRFEPRTSQT